MNEPYRIVEGASGGTSLTSYGPDGNAIMSLPSGASSQAIQDIIPARAFQTMPLCRSIAVTNPTENGYYFPDASAYVGPYTISARISLPTPLSGIHVQVRTDAAVFINPNGTHTVYITCYDTDIGSSPGVQAPTFISTVPTSGGGWLQSSAYDGAGNERVALDVAIGYDQSGADSSNYAPAHTPNVLWANNVGSVQSIGIGQRLFTYPGTANQYWRVMQVIIGTHQSTNTSLPVWWIGENGSYRTGQQPLGLGPYLGKTYTYTGNGIKALNAGSDLEIWCQDNGTSPTQFVCDVLLYVGP